MYEKRDQQHHKKIIGNQKVNQKVNQKRFFPKHMTSKEYVEYKKYKELENKKRVRELKKRKQQEYYRKQQEFKKNDPIGYYWKKHEENICLILLSIILLIIYFFNGITWTIGLAWSVILVIVQIVKQSITWTIGLAWYIIHFVNNEATAWLIGIPVSYYLYHSMIQTDNPIKWFIETNIVFLIFSIITGGIFIWLASYMCIIIWILYYFIKWLLTS